jgi:hypothetical protein
MGLVLGEVQLQRAHEISFALLRREGDRLPFNFDGLRKTARLGVGRRYGVENRGVVFSGEPLCPFRENQGLGAVANRRIGAGRKYASRQIEHRDSVGFDLERKAQMSEGIRELPLQIECIPQILMSSRELRPDADGIQPGVNGLV